MQKTVHLITGILLVMVAGLFWGTWFSLSRTMNELPADTFITIGNQIIKNVAVPMSLIMPLSLLGLVVLIVWSWKTRSAYFYCMVSALVLFIVALIITVGVEVPIDNQIKTWTTATVPANWESIRDRWEFYHTLRTFVSLGGIGFFMIALMNKME